MGSTNRAYFGSISSPSLVVERSEARSALEEARDLALNCVGRLLQRGNHPQRDVRLGLERVS